MALATGAIVLPAIAQGEPIAAPRPSGRRRTPPLMAVAAGVAVLGALVLGGLRLSGVQWLVVTTPSMGTAVPVGSLIVDVPVVAADVRTGDVITFLPPGSGAPHTHRVIAVDSAGISTRGDANGSADPWTLRPADLLGRAVLVLPGGGWLLRALPFLLAGTAVTLVAALLLRRPDLRAAVITVGASSTVAVASIVLRPFVNAVLLTATTTARGSVATLVSTGVLPVRVTSSSGSHVDLVSGQVGVLRTVAAGDRVDLSVGLHLPAAGWALVATICALPLLVPLVAAIRSRAA